jgi:hypothetical protein
VIRLLQWLFLGHIHKWKTLSDGTLTTVNETGQTKSRGQRYVQQCERCGIVVKRDLI